MNRVLFFLLTLTFVVMVSSCSGDGAIRTNPFLQVWDTPFQTPPFEKIEDRDYLPAFEEAMARHNEEINVIVNGTLAPSFENVIVAYDNAGVQLSTISRIFSMKNSADTSPTLQRVNEEISERLSAHGDAITFNEALFAKVKSVYDSRNGLNLSADQARLLDKVYNSFVRNGALLEGAEKQRLAEVNSELSRLSVLFGNNVLGENNAFVLELEETDLVGLPNNVKSSAKNLAQNRGLKNKWVVTLQSPSWIPFVTYSERRDLRERVYRAYISKGDNGNELDNKEIATQIVKLRAERAKLLGFDSHADYIIDNQMAKSPEAVYSLLDKIYAAALERSKSEMEEMNKLFVKDNPEGEFASWDWWYYAEKMRKKSFNLDEEELKPYFSVGGVRRGIFTLSNRLFGITFRPIVVEHYNEDCTAYEVLDIDGSHLGILYLDLYARDTKRAGAWCGFLREQRYANGERVSPIVAIVCNFPPAPSNAPALLTSEQSATFFHEFGHALHFLFQDSPYRSIGRVEGDFVEFPSQILENWAFEPELLKQYAFHHKTNAVIPDKLINAISKSATFNQGFKTTELAAAALSDLDIHSLKSSEIGADFDINAFEREALNERRGLIEQIEPRYRYPYFNHIFSGGYSAGYYFYLWAEVLEKDGYQAFVESGDIFNRDVATRLRRSVLERGGTRDGMDMYCEFRGKQPSQQALLNARGLNVEN